MATRGGVQGGGTLGAADGGETPKRKRIKDLNGIELRMKCRQDLDPRALTELERRRDNLHGAVIPAWEREARGERTEDWDLVG